MKCTSLFFAQGEDAQEALKWYDNDGALFVVDYLSNIGALDQEDGEEYDCEDRPWGTASVVEYFEDYIIAVNLRLDTIGVYKIIQE